MSLIAIVFSTSSKMIRRIIIPDSDDELKDPASLRREGESVLVVEKPSSHDLYTCEDLVHKATGVKPARHLCHVVNSNNEIVNTIHADPEIDKIHGHTLRLVK